MRSGTLWRKDIVVAAEQAFAHVEEAKVVLGDGSSFAAHLTGRDPGTNVVALRLDRAVDPTPLVAAVTPTAGGLVFTGDLNGDVLGLDAETGSVVWHDSTDAPIGGGVIAYQSGGRQRIAVAAGMNSRVWPVKTTTARIVVYGIP